ncbi:ferredoxin reductase [Leifsonia sp. Leaf264]|uniref:ferredoxin reductase n=1 Tax=Leifsonia sp. Leaf264 TaxID=1736314 RepID=UPI000B0AD43F|nr:ferredoxin reductase [Leifsonia sp. Leaf264]
MSAASDTAWRVGTVTEVHPETPSARRIIIDVAEWPGNIAGQHLDVRLTAPDGYSATRSYSIASAGPGTRVDLAVDKLPDGEVSPFLVDDLMVGDMLEIHGPLGGWFVWEPDAAPNVPGDGASATAGAASPRPVQLIGGGSGVVPLVAMIRSHVAAEDTTPFRLLYSVRTPEDVFFPDVLADDAGMPALRVDLIYTRRAPDGWPVTPARITREVVESSVFPASANPRVYLCGSTAFVETVAAWLVDLGHDPRSIRTERFGGTS